MFFSKGTEMDIAERFGVEFVAKHSIQISRMHVLYLFLKENPLEMEDDDSDIPNYKSFNKTAYWVFTISHRRAN